MGRSGDTPNHSRNLCETCDNAVIVQGHADSQKLIYCSSVDFRGVKFRGGIVPFPVSSCSAYEERQTLSLSQMERMAYFIENKDGKVGFRRLTPQERHGDY